MNDKLLERIASIKEVEPDEIDLQMMEDFEDEVTENPTDWNTYKANRKADVLQESPMSQDKGTPPSMKARRSIYKRR